MRGRCTTLPFQISPADESCSYKLPSDFRRLGPGDSRLSTQVVLITGGLTGIGRAAAVAFAKKGAKGVVAGGRDEAGKELVDGLRSLGSEAEFINADVRKEDDVRAMVDKTVA